MMQINTIKKIGAICALMPTLLLVGCAQTIHLTPQMASKIKTVKIKHHVKKPATMYYYSPGSGTYEMFGVIGDAIATNINEEDAAQDQAIVKKDHISIAQIVREAFTKQMREHGRFPLTTKKHASAYLKITIKKYGFTIRSGFASKVQPVLSVVGRLVLPNGRVVWQDQESVSAWTSNLPQYYPANLFYQPKKIRQLWNIAANEVTRRLVQSMNSN